MIQHFNPTEFKKRNELKSLILKFYCDLLWRQNIPKKSSEWNTHKHPVKPGVVLHCICNDIVGILRPKHHSLNSHHLGCICTQLRPSSTTGLWLNSFSSLPVRFVISFIKIGTSYSCSLLSPVLSLKHYMLSFEQGQML